MGLVFPANVSSRVMALWASSFVRYTFFSLQDGNLCRGAASRLRASMGFRLTSEVEIWEVCDLGLGVLKGLGRGKGVRLPSDANPRAKLPCSHFLHEAPSGPKDCRRQTAVTG